MENEFPILIYTFIKSNNDQESNNCKILDELKVAHLLDSISFKQSQVKGFAIFCLFSYIIQLLKMKR